MPAAEPTAGGRTACWGSPTVSTGSASRWRCGTGTTRSSRNGCSASPGRNQEKLFNAPNAVPFTRDAFHQYVIEGRSDAVNPHRHGTRCAAHYVFDVPAGGEAIVRLRLCAEDEAPDGPLGATFDETFSERIREAGEFYAAAIPGALSDEERRVARQACAGLLWSKQFYHYVLRDGSAQRPSRAFVNTVIPLRTGLGLYASAPSVIIVSRQAGGAPVQCVAVLSN